MNSELLNQLIDRAVAVLNQHIVPGGISDRDALSELYGIFDGPEYRAAITAPPAPTHSRESLQSLIAGMTVSLDVSTGEHDAEHRYYGIVNEVMDDPASKHGVTLLVYDAKQNFTAPPAPEAGISWRESEIKSALIAYALEFPLTNDGDPDVGNIHANIRALKKRADDAVFKRSFAAMESGIIAELVDALIGVIRVADRETDEFDAARAAIAKATGGQP
jgi:hypothetical protein